MQALGLNARAIRTIKFTTLAYLPWLDYPGRAAIRFVRRLFRIPHQQSYARIGSLPDLLPDGLYLDIGANNGQSVESIRLYRPRARIVAFEINAPLARKLTTRYPDVTVHSVGLGNTAREVDLFVPACGKYEFAAAASMNSELASSFLRRRVRARGVVKKVKSQLRTLDSFDLNPVFMKVDVEGAEREVIEGAMETIKRSRPVMLVEHGERLMDLLGPLGYILVPTEGLADVYLMPQRTGEA